MLELNQVLLVLVGVLLYAAIKGAWQLLWRKPSAVESKKQIEAKTFTCIMNRKKGYVYVEADDLYYLYNDFALLIMGTLIRNYHDERNLVDRHVALPQTNFDILTKNFVRRGNMYPEEFLYTLGDEKFLFKFINE